MEARIRIFMDVTKHRLPTLCPQLWANDRERKRSQRPRIVGFPGDSSHFRLISGLRREFESLQGHRVMRRDIGDFVFLRSDFALRALFTRPQALNAAECVALVLIADALTTG